MSRLPALAWKELLLLSRDPHGLVVLFLVPALFVLLMSLALRDAFAPDRQAALAVQVVDRDGGALAGAFREALAAQTGVALDAGSPQLRIEIPPDFSRRLAARLDQAGAYAAGAVEPPLLHLAYAPTLLPQSRGAGALAVRLALQTVQTDLMMQALGVAGPDAAALRYASDPRRLPFAEGFTGGSDAAAPSAVQHSVPAWLIFALFFSVIPLATSFVVERMEGSLVRLRALDVPALVLLGSKALAYYGVNLLQIGAMLAIGVWVVPWFGGESLVLPPAPFALWLLGSATALAALGLALLVAVCVRTTTQATVAGGAVSLLLAALGGIMVPKLVMPPAMQAATQASPMSWALEGFWDLLLRGGGWRDVLPEAGALALFGMGALALAALLFGRAQRG